MCQLFKPIIQEYGKRRGWGREKQEAREGRKWWGLGGICFNRLANFRL